MGNEAGDPKYICWSEDGTDRETFGPQGGCPPSVEQKIRVNVVDPNDEDVDGTIFIFQHGIHILGAHEFAGIRIPDSKLPDCVGTLAFNHHGDHQWSFEPHMVGVTLSSMEEPTTPAVAPVPDTDGQYRTLRFPLQGSCKILIPGSRFTIHIAVE